MLDVQAYQNDPHQPAWHGGWRATVQIGDRMPMVYYPVDEPVTISLEIAGRGGEAWREVSRVELRDPLEPREVARGLPGLTIRRRPVE